MSSFKQNKNNNTYLLQNLLHKPYYDTPNFVNWIGLYKRMLYKYMLVPHWV